MKVEFEIDDELADSLVREILTHQYHEFLEQEDCYGWGLFTKKDFKAMRRVINIYSNPEQRN
jgi:hypothetical protein